MTIPVFYINWDSIDLTRESIKQLRENTDLEKISITVFDNGSSDPENIEGLKALKQCGHIDRIIASRNNLGFSLAVNIGLAESDGDIFCFMSNDCFVEPGWLEAALKTLQSDPAVAAVCPNLYDEKNGENRYLIEFTTKRPEKIAYDDHYIGQLYGAIMIFQRDAWENIGCLDYINFSPAYSEELDWSYRALKHGYRLKRSGRSLAQHLGQATTNKKYIRNEIHLIRLHHRIKCRLLNLSVRQLAGLMKQYIREVIFAVKDGTIWVLISAILKNIASLPQSLSDRKKRFKLEKVDFNYPYRLAEEDGVEYVLSNYPRPERR